MKSCVFTDDKNTREIARISIPLCITHRLNKLAKKIFRSVDAYFADDVIDRDFAGAGIVDAGKALLVNFKSFDRAGEYCPHFRVKFFEVYDVLA